MEIVGLSFAGFELNYTLSLRVCLMDLLESSKKLLTAAFRSTCSLLNNIRTSVIVDLDPIDILANEDRRLFVAIYTLHESNKSHTQLPETESF